MTSPDELEFDKAHSTGTHPIGVVACSSCHTAIPDWYYSAVGKAFCERCKSQLDAALSSKGHFGRGLLFGIGGGIAGAAVYYGVAAVSGLEIALIAILVGWLVGRGMQIGAKAVGRKYQVAAVVVTYLAISGSYLALEIRNARRENAALPGLTRAPSATPAPSRDSVGPAPTVPSSSEPKRASVGRVVVILATLLLSLPIMAGFANLPSSLIGLLIVGIGLHQAWRMNRKPDIQITGPFRIGPEPPAEMSPPS